MSKKVNDFKGQPGDALAIRNRLLVLDAVSPFRDTGETGAPRARRVDDGVPEVHRGGSAAPRKDPKDPRTGEPPAAARRGVILDVFRR